MAVSVSRRVTVGAELCFDKLSFRCAWTRSYANDPEDPRGGSLMSDTIVLLHGSATGSSSWDPVAGPLASSGARVLAPDLLGYGQSPVPTGSYGIAEEVAHLVRPGAAHMIPITHPGAVVHALRREVVSQTEAKENDHERSPGAHERASAIPFAVP